MGHMFCYQCQETAQGTGCTVKGVCGKESDLAQLMDLLVYAVQGIAVVNCVLRNVKKESRTANRFITDALFSTITNANFDEAAISERIERGLQLRDRLIRRAQRYDLDLPSIDELLWTATPREYLEKAATVGVLSEENEDIRSLKQLITYGLKGVAAYAEHAAALGFEDDEQVDSELQMLLADIAYKPMSRNEYVDAVNKTGLCGVAVMDLLDKANSHSYGNPEITEVDLGVGIRPGILVSGHDLSDLKLLLEQSKKSGVDIYTHSEMLPAHAYPQLKRYKHLKGNYGNSWWKQTDEFQTFNGPILFTTNCIVPPRTNANYTDRIYTTNSAGYPGCPHIKPDDNDHKDFTPIIEHAKKCAPPEAIEEGKLTIGFAHHQVLAIADKLIDAIKAGKIRKLIVMSGCDGRFKQREYYTQFAEELPKDCVILTSGCAKYRYNKLNLGTIDGIPRVLDAGQCNDSYSWVVVAQKLAEAFKVKSINELPLVFNIAWYEQKAVIVLLALLSLGVKNIHLGPTLPACLSPAVRDFIIREYELTGISTADDDMKAWV
ncbi:MAG: hydroxylamine reductase [Marinifilaceae bacterium]